GDLHIHDLGTLGAYCVGWDLSDLLLRGFHGVRGKIESRPANHFRVALLHIVNFLYTLQGESAGAQALSNVDTYLAPFIRADGLSYEEVRQHLQEFLYNMNVPTRVGFQTPFTNVSLDLEVPEYLRDEAVILGGRHRSTAYGDYQHEMDLFNRAFAEVMLEGDVSDRPFTFPIPTYSITEGFPWEREHLAPVWEMTAKYGIPYFSNFVGSDMSPEDARSMCCRLRIDNRVLHRRGGGLFGANPLTGSIGVVTLNLPRLGHLAEDREAFFVALDALMDLAHESLGVKRKTLERLTERGLYPYSKVYLDRIREASGCYWSNHFSTIGVVGMNEAALNLLGCSIADSEGTEFAVEVLDHMRERLRWYQAETEDLYNLEATPAESTGYRLARTDLERFPSIRIFNLERYGGEVPYYTNSTQLPVGHTDDLFAALSLQDPLQERYTGGTVFHAFLGEQLPSGEAVAQLVRRITDRFRMPYFTITPTFSICRDHGYQQGGEAVCPSCGQPVEVYSRVAGYLRPVEQWNDGKRAEFADRVTYARSTAIHA
ncbi:MAG: ribonucleoside triphosphate reductase, partial [Candidatus Bipolaricaulota bacterium]